MTSFLTILGKGAALSQDALGAWALLASVGHIGPRTLCTLPISSNLSCGDGLHPSFPGAHFHFLGSLCLLCLGSPF